MTFYEEEMPQAVREEIQRIADTSEMTISATQDAPVFTVPPRAQEPPQKEEPVDPYPKLAAQVLRFVGEFDGSRMGYGEDDAQAVENIARQLHDPVQREEIRRLLQSFLDHADLEEEIAVDITLCMEQIAELPPALTPEQAQIEEIAGYLEEAGYAVSSELVEEGLMDYRAHGGKGNSQDVADFIEREFLSEEPEPASLEIAKEFINDFCEAEYGSPADFSDLEKVGIAYTTVTDEEIPIQVNADLVHYRIERYLDGQFLERRQYESLDELIQNELAELDFDQLTSVDQDYFNGKYPPDIEPYIFCEWSESPVFEDGKRYGIREFDTLMKQADEEQVAGAKAALEKYGTWQAWYESDDPENARFLGYDKVKFTVVMPDGTTYTERQDIGDGDGGVLDFLAQYPKYQDILPLLQQSTPPQNDYMLLSRLKADCDYFLGAGGRAEKHLWAGNVREQIAKMRELYDALPEKPEWLTMEDIDRYAQRMEPPYEVVVYHHFEADMFTRRTIRPHVAVTSVDTASEALAVRDRIKILRSEATGQWSIREKNADRSNVKAITTYGTKRMSAYHILEQTLNQRDVRVFDYIEDENGKKKPVLNKKETAIAQDRQELIKQKFAEWIWKDIDRRELLCRVYNETFNGVRPREYDGRHIRFEGMNPEISLRPHQINAIAHILYGGNTLLAHEVGAGKTYEMVAAAMEMKRLGLCTKSLIVVPNHITEQWAAEWLQLYPSANILVATKKDFETLSLPTTPMARWLSAPGMCSASGNRLKKNALPSLYSATCPHLLPMALSVFMTT